MTVNKIMCFRAIDFRDRIRDPFLTFSQALEALQAVGVKLKTCCLVRLNS